MSEEDDWETCQTCGKKFPYDRIQYTKCPYAVEMSIDPESVFEEWMCEDCYGNAVGDI